MRRRVIFKHGRYWPQYKFAGLMWCFYTEQADPMLQPEQVSFEVMTDAINYCSSAHYSNSKAEVVWQSN